jgi:serine/threonine protein phosphatase PrpC
MAVKKNQGDRRVFQFIDRLFGKKKASPSPVVNIQTAPLSDAQIDAVSNQTLKFEPAQYLVGLGQSIGKQRDHNEDTLYALNALLCGTTTTLPFGIFIVADGMGGYEHGEVASNLAARIMANTLVRKLYLPYFSPKQEGQSDPLQEIMKDAFREANQAVLKQVPGGGTTLTTAFILGEQVTLTHVGDSRAYFIYPDGRMQVITRDHSLVRRLIELGQITEKEAAVHPQRNVLYRAIGQSEPVEADVSTFPIPHPGYMMLCSDGLWGYVSELDLFRIIMDSPTPTVACHKLVEVANAAGGPDNISVILIQFLN